MAMYLPCSDTVLPYRVSPFGYLRVYGYLLLTAAFRSLSRPSSAPDAKAFPLRSFQLDLSPFSQRLVREFLVLFENYAGLQRSKLYVTLHPFGCCSTINLFPLCLHRETSLLPYLLLSHCSVFKVQIAVRKLPLVSGTASNRFCSQI